MATFDCILSPAQTVAINIAGLGASASSSEQALGAYAIFAINATQDITIKFGPPGVGAASATDFRIPQNSTMVFDVGSRYTSFRCFNLGSSSATIYILLLSKS